MHTNTNKQAGTCSLPISLFDPILPMFVPFGSSFWTFLIITPHSSRLHRRFDLLSAVPSPNTEVCMHMTHHTPSLLLSLHIVAPMPAAIA